MFNFQSERYLEDYIFEKYKEDKKLVVTGESFRNVYRQFRISGVGVADLIFSDPGCEAVKAKPAIHIVELKNKPVDANDMAQLCRYVAYFERHLSGVDVIGYLVGPSIKSNDVMPISCVSEGKVEVYTFSVGFDGITFESVPPFQNENESPAEAQMVFGKIKTSLKLVK